jgi:hypothetical protein
MKTTIIDKLISARLALAGLRTKASFRDNLAHELATRLEIGTVLSKIPNAEIYSICDPAAGKNGGSK